MKKMILLLLVAITVIAAGCPKNPPVPAQTVVDVAAMHFQKVAVLPFVRLESADREVSAPLTREVYDTCPIMGNAEVTLWTLLEKALDSRSDISRVPSADVEGAMNSLSIDQSLNLRLDGKFQREIAKKVGADIALFGFVYCFKERAGSAIAASDSASVGFDLVMVDAKTGNVLWKARFSQKQQPLSNNLLDAQIFLQRKGQWITAAELAEEGIQGMVRQIPSPAGLVSK